MSYAFVVQVQIELATAEQNMKMLREAVVPQVKAQAGFVRGVWLRSADGKTGMGVVVFDTEQNAKSAAEAMPAMRPPDAPPVVSSGIYEVTAEA